MERPALKVGDCAIVVPAHGEEQTIASVVSALRDVAPVIVVDDASTDETAARAEAAGAIVVRHLTNRGYGSAVDTGFRTAIERGFRKVVTADGDGQHDAAEIAEFVRLLAEGFDLVVGVRPGPHRFAERVCGWYARFALGMRDPLCGLKAYDVRFYVQHGGFDRMNSVGTELAAYAVRNGARWTQRPIRLHSRRDGTSRFYRSLRSDVRILRSLRALVLVR